MAMPTSPLCHVMVLPFASARDADSRLCWLPA
jgi:hypothetical protein